MNLLEAAFLFIVVYMVVEVIAMPIAALRGRDVQGRVIVWLAASLILVVLWFVLTAKQGQVLT